MRTLLIIILVILSLYVIKNISKIRLTKEHTWNKIKKETILYNYVHGLLENKI